MFVVGLHNPIFHFTALYQLYVSGHVEREEKVGGERRYAQCVQDMTNRRKGLPVQSLYSDFVKVLRENYCST